MESANDLFDLNVGKILGLPAERKSRVSPMPAEAEDEGDLATENSISAEDEQVTAGDATTAAAQADTQNSAGVGVPSEPEMRDDEGEQAGEEKPVDREEVSTVKSAAPKARAAKRASKTSKPASGFALEDSVRPAVTGGTMDMARFALDIRATAGVRFEKTLVVGIGKPPKGEYFRASPDPAMRAPLGLVETDNGQSCHLATSELAAELLRMGEAACVVKDVRLIALASGGYHLLPLRLPNENGLLDIWGQSMWDCWEESLSNWVRVASNTRAGRYDGLIAKGDLGEPSWPDKTFSELLGIAFKGRVLESLDHPILRRLRGEIR